MVQISKPTKTERRTFLKLMGAGTLATTGTAVGATDQGEGNSPQEPASDEYDPFPVWDKAESCKVISSDGTAIHVEETGNEDGEPILFIHGAFQSRLAWDKQMFDGLRDGVEESYDGLGEEFRLVAMDLRGHGLSGKPEPGDAYRAELSADDVHAVITELDIDNPVLVGWSFGGFVINDYIANYGDDAIKAINMVDTSGGIVLPGEEDPGDEEDENQTYREIIESNEAFVRSLFYDDLSPRDFYYFLGFNLIVAQGAISSRGPTNYNDLLPTIDVPTLVTQGKEDPIVSMRQAKYLNQNIPLSRLSAYPQVAHSPFWEDPARFNTELTKFVRNPEKYVKGSYI